MKISQKGIDLICKWEGYHTRLPDGSCKAYLDTVANPPIWTIGYGSTGPDIKEGLVWTHQQAVNRLRNVELPIHEAAVHHAIRVPMNQNQFDALVSFSYNYGIGRATSLKNAVNAGDWERAGNLLCNTYAVVKGKGVIRGLLNRRRDERDLMWTLPPKEVVKASTKLNTFKRLRTFVAGLFPAGGFLEWLGYLETVKAFVTENWHFILLGLVAVFYVTSKWLETKAIQDHEDGRYEPSKGFVKDYKEEDPIDVLDDTELVKIPADLQPAA